ncbi:MAG: hypothetical protein ABWK01_05515 [Infirmifilum sp.]
MISSRELKETPGGGYDFSNWRVELAQQLGLVPVYTPVTEDFVLLLLYLDGRAPFYGEEILHLCFFLYPYVRVKASPTLFIPLSSDVEKAVLSLKEKGLVEERKEFRGGRYVNTVRLSDQGVSEARKVFSTFANSWILTNDFVLRKGAEMISELEALKKTYNDKTPLELLKVLASKIDSEGEAFVKRLNLESERRERMIIDIGKQLLRDLKLLTREFY